MKVFKNIIEQCHEQHRKTLRQRKTVMIPVTHKHHFKVYCARGYLVDLDALEQADISFMPIGLAPKNDVGPRDFGAKRFLKRQGIKDWRSRQLHVSWGIQIYTGTPSERDGARWHDLHFTYQAICAAPESVLACIEALVNTTPKPLLTLTKSGGLRFSCRVLDYLHPDTPNAKFYIYKHTPTPENRHDRDVYLEILGDKGYSRWDARYAILLGNPLDPPIISEAVLFTTLNALRDALHEPDPSGETPLEPVSVTPFSLGSANLDLAKSALVKHSFSYLREEQGFHHWVRQAREDHETHISLWEDRGIVWVRGATPDPMFPTTATPITAIYDDTGITPPTDPPVSNKVLSVREGTLSPLSLKRASPVLHRRPADVKKTYESFEEKIAEIQRVYEQGTRIIGILSETGLTTDTALESYVLKQGETCQNIPRGNFATAAEHRYQTHNLPSVARWRARHYRWEQAKALPVDERMANPFQSGNPCEDPERCHTLEQKGGSALESICPQCPVHTECQTRGYLSQPEALKNVTAQISPTPQLFLNPKHAEQATQLLVSEDGTERTCILDEKFARIRTLFLQCQLSRDVLEGWSVNYQGKALGNFAKSLLNISEFQSEPNASMVTRVRATVEGFQGHEASLINQMCHVNIRGKVVARGLLDPETGKALARSTIEFEGGAFAYIPSDAQAEDRLREKGLPLFYPDAFVLDETIDIQMQMADAIALNILDTQTVESIQGFPTVSRDPNWTFWHQLKRFFSHYTRDADAPMYWDDDALLFWIPPTLHPGVKRLLLISPTLSKRQLHKIFPDEKIEVIGTRPMAWVPGNSVFQLRTGNYSARTILNNDSVWDVPGLSKQGEQFFADIRAEIDRDPSVTHGIITNMRVAPLLTDIVERENVCLLKQFKTVNPVDLENVDVVWMIGVPLWPQKNIWSYAQMLHGNDEESLYYEEEVESGHYKDERLQKIYYQRAAGLLTQIIGYVGLSTQMGKKVVILTSIELPDISDRPETRLFDWEDFQVAGGLDKLTEIIATREQFETEAAQLTAESSREEVERILGCSARTANRFLKKLRGSNIRHLDLQEQILTFLSSNGEKKASEIVVAVSSSPQSVGNVLRRLVDTGEIVKVRRGVYALPKKP